MGTGDDTVGMSSAPFGETPVVGTDFSKNVSPLNDDPVHAVLGGIPGHAVGVQPIVPVAMFRTALISKKTWGLTGDMFENAMTPLCDV
jgi:hypothetical protein